MNCRRLMGITPRLRIHELIIAPCIAAKSGYSCPSSKSRVLECPLHPESGQVGRTLISPLCAISGQMHRNKWLARVSLFDHRVGGLEQSGWHFKEGAVVARLSHLPDAFRPF